MRSNSRQPGQGKPSFIEAARRRQIVDTAIQTIATRGYSQTSLAEIARDAGISKGVISYHFEGKRELVEAILSRLLREPAEFIKERVDSCERPLDKLRAYIQANFDYMKSNRSHYVALVALWGVRTSSDERHEFDAEAYLPSRGYLSRIIENGQESGELRPAPLKTMASVIQASIDGVMLQWVYDADAIDLDACREEILNMISAHLAVSHEGRPVGS
ncbi:MAG: TetR/AcrR family transcriptional regulator [Deltaproteobacteria bacterium]|nr:TetR/AcrR family transcriptional regulator [Deltaproteobacteria bacterium]